MADVINIAEIQKLIESDPEKALVVSYLGSMLYDSFAAHQPKRFKAFVAARFGGGPMPFDVQAKLVHDRERLAGGFCDDLEGEGSMCLVPDIHDGEWFGFRVA